MSALRPSTCSSARPPIQVVINKDAPQTTQALTNQQLIVRWQVSRRALAERAPSGTRQAVHLELHISEGTSFWSLIDPKDTHRIIVTDKHQPNPLSITQSDDLLCIESTSLRIIVSKPKNKPADLCYVRTDIFKQLNLPGGRFNVVTCILTDS